MIFDRSRSFGNELPVSKHVSLHRVPFDINAMEFTICVCDNSPKFDYQSLFYSFHFLTVLQFAGKNVSSKYWNVLCEDIFSSENKVSSEYFSWNLSTFKARYFLIKSSFIVKKVCKWMKNWTLRFFNTTLIFNLLIVWFLIHADYVNFTIMVHWYTVRME